MTRHPRDISGLRFGRLIVIGEDRSRYRKLWLCECECGRRKLVAKSNLIGGGTRSCGCFAREVVKAAANNLPHPGAP